MARQTGTELQSSDRRYIAGVMDAPMLERDEEFALARAWRDTGDVEALHRLAGAYARYVVRIAWKFRGYGLALDDLMQVGNVGLMEAARRFDPAHNARFSTYASWWIMAAIQDHILRNNAMVRVATTPAQRRLFFNLRRARAKLASGSDGRLTDADRELIADQLQVRPEDVARMETHLSGQDSSLNISLGEEDDGGATAIDMLVDEGPSPEEVVTQTRDTRTRSAWLHDALDKLSPRERQIICSRFLKEDRQTLSEIGDSFGVSKERVRQIEARALSKLRNVLKGRNFHPGTLLAN